MEDFEDGYDGLPNNNPKAAAPCGQDELPCSDAILDLLAERQRQDDKWGEQNHHPYKWLAILGEEVGESNKAILEGSLLNYRDELIQVAAVAIAAIECLERGTWKQ